HCIGATTLDEYRKHIEKDAALERRFQPVLVEPPSVEDTVSILRGLRERFEVHHGVRIQDNSLVAAATLSDRYISDRFLPDKAIERAKREQNLARAAELQYGKLPQLEQQLKEEEAKLAKETPGKRLVTEEVTEEEIAEIVSRWTGIPLTRLMEGEREKLLQL